MSYDDYIVICSMVSQYAVKNYVSDELLITQEMLTM